MNKNFKGKMLPKELWGKGLDSSDKILLEEIISLSKQPSGCYAGDEHFSELLEETSRNVSRRIQKLKKQERISITTIRDGNKYKRYIKFVSLVESDKSKLTSQGNETEKLSVIEIIETDKLTLGGTDKLIEGDGQNVSGIIQDNESQKMNSTDGTPVSNTRNEVEVRHALDQNLLDQKNTSKENLQIVPKPSLRCGEFRDNEADHNKTASNEERYSAINETLSIDIPKESNSIVCLNDQEVEFDEKDIADFRVAIDIMFRGHKLLNWEKLLRTKPLHTFLSETSKIHRGDASVVAMISLIKDNLK